MVRDRKRVSPLQVVAPTISSPVCQEQLIEASKLVAKSVEGCVEASQGATSDEGLLRQVGVAATGVTNALNDLLQHIKRYASGATAIGRHGEATDRILDVTDNIFSSMGDAGRWGIRGLSPSFQRRKLRRAQTPRRINTTLLGVTTRWRQTPLRSLRRGSERLPFLPAAVLH